MSATPRAPRAVARSRRATARDASRRRTSRRTRARGARRAGRRRATLRRAHARARRARDESRAISTRADCRTALRNASTISASDASNGFDLLEKERRSAPRPTSRAAGCVQRARRPLHFGYERRDSGGLRARSRHGRARRAPAACEGDAARCRRRRARTRRAMPAETPIRRDRRWRAPRRPTVP